MTFHATRQETDWAAFRAGFPALDGQTYLATAGGGPLSRSAAAAGARFYEEMLAKGDAPFGDWLARTDAARGPVARLIGGRAEDVAFLASASAAMNALTGYVAPGARVATLEGEFPSVTLPWINRGHPVTAVPLRDHRAPMEAIEEALDGAAALVVSHVQFRYGVAYDVAELGRMAQAAGALLFVDATQSMGAVPVSPAPGVSAILASGYKWLCAGYGVGVVWQSPELRDRRPPVFGWRSAEVPYALDPAQAHPATSARQLEMGHPPFAPVFALAGALEHLETVGLAAVWSRIQTLGRHLRAELAAHGLPAPIAAADESGIAVLPAPDGAAIKAALAEEGVDVSSSVGYLRLSVHAYNTEEEVSRGVSRLAAHWR